VSSASRIAKIVILGSIIFVGLPLLGWGFDDIPGFFAHPARLGYVVMVVLLQIVIGLLFPGTGRTGGEGKETVARQRLVVVLMQVFSIAIVFAGPFSDRREIIVFGQADGLRYLGLAVFALGFFGMNWAEAALGKLFSVQVTIQEGHRLITDGPYQYLRHPRYLGILVFNVGLALVFRSGLALIFVAALTLVLLWRIHDEEALMRQTFGADWDAYSGKSWRLIPFVY
jgi:protein-S-isoprenylcysteine O-methyltransferase Ste14